MEDCIHSLKVEAALLTLDIIRHICTVLLCSSVELLSWPPLASTTASDDSGLAICKGSTSISTSSPEQEQHHAATLSVQRGDDGP